MESYNKIQYTACEMFNDRGYIIKTQVPWALGMVDDIALMLTGTNSNNDDVSLFITYKRIGKNEILKFFNSKLTVQHVILVSLDEFTSHAKQVLREEVQNGRKIEFFLHKQMMFNVIRHKFQPNFRLLNESETIQLLKRLQCKLLQLNKILKSDPVAKYFDAQPKQVFEIVRNFMRGDRHEQGLAYRVVV